MIFHAPPGFYCQALNGGALCYKTLSAEDCCLARLRFQGVQPESNDRVCGFKRTGACQAARGGASIISAKNFPLKNFACKKDKKKPFIRHSKLFAAGFMIQRYSLPEMACVFTDESRFSKALLVEKTVAAVQAEMGLIPKKAARAIAKNARFTLKGILKEEARTHHDLTAFVHEIARRTGPFGGWIHCGLTSSDVLDTVLSLQLREAGSILQKPLKEVKKQLRRLISLHKDTICMGRTHGMHAEPTLFGYKLLGHFMELKRAEAGLQTALKDACRGKLSGAVGAYSSMPDLLEKRVLKQLRLSPESVSTQVIPRDRHARVLFALSLLGAFVERLALELRHLQRTEVGEVSEGFARGQTGSSAMPHKKNPVLSENLTGLARLLRSYISPALENIALWHERDISHSSVERVILPDSFTLAHFALSRSASLLKGLQVHKRRMRDNLSLSQGTAFSSKLLTALVLKGISRKEAYLKIQRLSLDLKKGESFTDKLQSLHVLSRKEIQEILSLKHLKALARKTESILQKS